MSTEPRRGRVFVDFYDYGNVGDDLLLLALARRYPHVGFDFVGEKSDGATFARQPNLRRLRRIPLVDGVLRRLRVPLRLNDVRRALRIRRARLVVRLGGSLYMERGDWRRNVERDRELLRCRGGALFLNGNFGPWHTTEFLEAYQRIFGAATDVTVRDSASLEQLRGVATVRLAPDMLFAIPSAGAPVRSGVVVSLVDLTGRGQLEALREAYESAIADLVADLVTRRGETVTLASFCRIEGDEAAVERVLALLPAEARAGVVTSLYRGDMDATVELLRTADTVVATRFHAMVLGMAFGARVCCLEYSDKLSNALRDLDAQDRGWTLPDFVAASREDRYRRVEQLEPASAAGVRDAAAGHFAVLDALLAPEESLRAPAAS